MPKPSLIRSRVLAQPKLILKHFRRMRELKPFPEADWVNNTVSVPLSFDVKRLPYWGKS